MENRNSRKEMKTQCPGVANNHGRSIVHIDIDCFYAQVEMIRNPELRSRPLGIQQKNIIVTCNYIARSYGVGKCMAVTEGLRLCPELTLVRGEDLQHYRKTSQDIFTLLQTYGCPVERLGMDENYIDVTSLVDAPDNQEEVVGHLYSVGCEQDEAELCSCGCKGRLAAASRLAASMRATLRERLSISSCAGIGTSKLLAKLAGATHRPDQQTVVLPDAAPVLLAGLGAVKNIPGIGAKTAQTLGTLGIHTVEGLQRCDPRILKETFSQEIANRLKALSLGEDTSEVKSSGKPGSLGLEDSFLPVSAEAEVRERFATLLRRLLALLRTETRRPGGLRVTVRQRTPPRAAHRATRHGPLPPSLFHKDTESGNYTADERKLMDLVMRLFRKLVDLSRPFHLTLIGLAFTKFQEVAEGRGSIAPYLMGDVSVQTVMDLQCSCPTLPLPSSSPPMDVEVSSVETEGASTAEPSPKKVRRARSAPCPSPGVGELRLSRLRLSPRPPSPALRPPPDVDREVFDELPLEMQEEICTSWARRPVPMPLPLHLRLDKPNTITRYFVPNKQ